MGIAHRLRLRMRAMLLAILLATETFAGTLEQTSAEYQSAIRTLETQGRDETAAAVHRLRQSFQQLADRFVSDPPPHLAGDPDWPADFMQIDVRLVGALLVIEMGSQDAARRSLAPLAETLARLRAPEPTAR